MRGRGEGASGLAMFVRLGREALVCGQVQSDSGRSHLPFGL